MLGFTKLYKRLNKKQWESFRKDQRAVM